MEVRKGYKQTEVGVIPDDWDIVQLDNITSEIGDGIHTTPKYVESSEFYFINGNNLSNGKIIISEDTKCVNETEYNRQKKRLNDKTILLSINGTIGNIAFYNGEKVVLGKSAAYIICKKSNFQEYIFYQLQSSRITEFYKNELTGSTINNLSLKSIRSTPIPLPRNEAEQTAIATALSDADALISSLEKLIAKKRSIKQGAMQELLKPKDGWESKYLGEIAKFYKGKGLAKNEIVPTGTNKCVHYGELFIKYKELISNVIGRTNFFEGAVLSKKNDVLVPTSDVTPTGLATASCLLEDNVILGGDILVIRIPETVLDGAFLSYFITNNKSQILNLVKGITVYHLYGSDMKRFKLNYPKISEQKDIVKLLSEMEMEIEALENNLSKYKMIKQGMMQTLLTGQIRLI